MATISFDKGTYKQGDRVTIKRGYSRETLNLRLKNPNNVVIFSESVYGAGSSIYTLPATALLGGYKAELFGLDPRTMGERILATATMKVVSGAPYVPPPAEGETRELDLGDYEVTWTLSGNDTLKAEITVTDTGVTCLSVTGGACYSATPPGVTISTFTVTGHLKSAVAPPAKMTKSELLTEIQNRGEVDLSKITTSSGWNKWVKKGSVGYWRIDYSDGTKYLIEIWNLHARNPPTRESDIHFYDIRPATPTAISKIETAWVLARINELPFVGVAPPTGFDDWVASKGGKDAITGGNINELTDAYIGLEDVGFSVTGADVNKVTDYYLGLG